MSRGQASYPFSITESVVTALLLLGVIYGAQSFTSGFIKEQSAGIEAERVSNAAMALSSVPEGYIEIEMSNYRIKVEDYTVYVKFRGTEKTAKINPDMVKYDSVDAPSTYRRVENYLCLRKTVESGNSVLHITTGGC
ncbi:MAG: hypothetical protein ABEJ75_04200 [Candidatus Nanohaloarchaea archaeon]